MYELVLVSRELRKQMKKQLPEDMPIVLGREPKGGWGIPWDSRVSRQHFEIRLLDGQLHVKLHKSAKNPLLFKGKAATQFECLPGEEFRVGRTVVKLVFHNESSVDEKKSYGGYSLKKPLGNSSAGTAFGGVDPKSRQQALVKVYTLEGLNADLQQMFEDELKPWVMFRATGAVTMTFDGGFENDHFYIARELVQGSTLAKWLEDKGVVPVNRATEIIKQAIRGLTDIHDAGLFHGNLKPSNVLMRKEGSIRLADPMLRVVVDALGEARFEASQFMAPEQIEYIGAANIVSDIYSLGCVWYTMLVGAPPFEPARTGDGTLSMRAAPADPRDRCPKLPNELFSVLFRMLEPKPENRYQTPNEILDEFSSSKVAGIRVRCDQCSHDYRLNIKYAGKVVKCRECGNSIRVRDEL